MIDRALRVALQRAAETPTLLVAADYDGTLAPIVDDPDLAAPHRGALGTLVALGHLPGVHVAIVSGRSRAALERLAGGPDGVQLVGTHGAEWGEESDDHDADPGVVAVTEMLAGIARDFEGTMVEVKPRGAALHYRHAADRLGAAQAAVAAGRSLGVRTIEGKEVVELLVGDADKGSAIEHLRQSSGAGCVVFIGDDTTDEDVFATLREDDVGIKVGPEASRAAHRVADPQEVAEVLTTLHEARSP